MTKGHAPAACKQGRDMPLIDSAPAPLLRPNQRVRLVGLVARSELNGLEANVVELDEDGQRWRVRLDDGTGRALHAANLQTVSSDEVSFVDMPAPAPMGVGSHVRICDLPAALPGCYELNGCIGEILGFHEPEQRWEVQIRSLHETRLLRGVHLEPCRPPEVAAPSAAVPSARQGTATPAALATTSTGTLKAGADRAPYTNGSEGLTNGARVRVHGVVTRPELNGQEGVLAGWDDSDLQWKVLMDDDSGKMFRPVNLQAIKPAAKETDAPSLKVGMRVRTTGLEARPDIDGLEGMLQSFDFHAQRWCVLLDDGGTKMLRPCNLEEAAADVPGIPVGTVTCDRSTGATRTANTAAVPDLRPGDRVRVHGLKFRPELNGQLGVVVGWDHAESRWKVRMDDSTGKLLLPANLELRPTGLVPGAAPPGPDPIGPGARIRVCGLEARPELNGASGTVTEWDPIYERWKVNMDDGSVKILRDGNMQVCRETQAAEAPALAQTVTPRAAVGPSRGPVMPGDRVCVTGIQSQPHLNGQLGTVVAWDEGESRWKVRMERDGSGKMFKPLNLQLPDPEVSGVATPDPASRPTPAQPAPMQVPAPASAQPQAPAPAPSAPVPALAASEAGDFAVSARVRVRGIQTQPHLNGQLGTVMGWDDGEARWQVCMDSGAGKLLRAQNIELAEAPADCGGPPGLEAEPAAIASEKAAAEQAKAPVAAPGAVGTIKPGGWVRVCGLEARPELNGQLGIAQELDEVEGRWKVRMQDGSGKMFRPWHLEACDPQGNPIVPLAESGMPAAQPAAATDEAQPVTAPAGPERTFAPGAEFVTREFVTGDRVGIRGIISQPELNGQFGRVVEWDGVESRWKVRMDDGSGKMFRPLNLVRSGPESSLPGPVAVESILPQASTQPPTSVKVSMDDCPGKMFMPQDIEHGGSNAPPGGPAAQESTPTVVPQQSTVAAEVPSMAIVPGLRVAVHGIQSQPHLNGQLGTVVEWDEGEARWKVLMDDGARKMLRPQNLESLAAAATTAAAAGPRAEHGGDTLMGGEASAASGVDELAPGLIKAIMPGVRVSVHGIKSQPDLNGQCGSVVQWDESEGRWKVRMDDGSGKMLKPQNLAVCKFSSLPPDVLAPESQDPTAATAKGVPEAGTSTPIIGPGAHVRICGIKAQPHLNGQLAAVVDWDEPEGRWKVRMEEDGSGKMFRPQNLQLVTAAPMEQPSSAGPALTKAVMGVAGATGAAGGNSSTKAAVAALAPGKRVRVRGIQAQPHLNGQLGSLVEWDDAEGRWKVHMDNGSGKMLKPANLEACDSPSAPAVPLDPVVKAADSAEPMAASTNSVASLDLAPGKRVKVCGLKARPDLNGQLGYVVAWDDDEARWQVCIDDGTGKSLKPGNLEACNDTVITPIPPAPAAMEQSAPVPVPTAMGMATGVQVLGPRVRVRVHGLKARPELNGQLGTVLEWDEEEGRWKVRMDDGSGKMYKPANLEEYDVDSANMPVAPANRELVPGVRVRVVGLQAQTELNGQLGHVVEWDEAEDRWRVRMDDLSGKSFRPSNLKVCDPIDTEIHSPLLPSAVPGSEAPSTATNGRAIAAPGECLASGVRVRVCGLKACPHVNGQLGHVVKWDDGEGRWKVRMDDGTGKSLKPENIEACGLLCPEPVPPEPVTTFSSAVPLATDPPPAEEQQETTPVAASGQALAPGARVQICGMKVRTELNGQLGKVVEWDIDESRYKVLMDDGSGKLLKVANLQVCEPEPAAPGAVPAPAPAAHLEGIAGGHPFGPGARIMICGLQTQSELNGQQGSVVEWDDGQGRWKVRMDDGTTNKMLLPTELEVCKPIVTMPSPQAEPAPTPVAASASTAPGQPLTPGDRVRVHGLQARQELNGQLGYLVAWDDHESRWRVRMDDGSGKLLKPLNLETHKTPPAGATPQAPAPRCVTSLQGLQDPPKQPEAVVGSAAPLVAASVSCTPRQTIMPGSRVRVCGLQSRPDLNGQLGSVAEWDDGEDRWKVRMDDGSGKMLKPVNLEACDSPSAPAVPLDPVVEAADSAAPMAASTNSVASLDLAPGKRVKVCGLKARPDLNGQLGSVVAWDDDEARWQVCMDDGTGKSLKPGNLEACDDTVITAIPPALAAMEQSAPVPVPTAMGMAAGVDGFGPGVRVRVHGLKARPELNGQLGTVVEWDEEEGRWKVHMDDGSGKMYKPANLAEYDVDSSNMSVAPTNRKLMPGVRIRVVGLQERTELNGHLGQVVEWDEGEDRWRVRMDDVSRKSFRPANLEVCDPIDMEIPAPLVPSTMPGSAAASTVATGTAIAATGERLASGVRVRVCGLKASPHVNGQLGHVVEWDDGEGRWKVRMDDGTAKSFKPENVKACGLFCPEPVPPAPVTTFSSMAPLATDSAPTDAFTDLAPREGLAPGMRARICGLQAVPELNGQLSTVVDWDEREGRWKVLMDDESRKMLKPANLEPVSPAADMPAMPEPQEPSQSVPMAPWGCPPEASLTQDPMPLPMPKLPGPVPTQEGAVSAVLGMTVTIQGLKAHPELNGLVGTITEWDAKEGRWKVTMTDDSGTLSSEIDSQVPQPGVAAAPWSAPAFPAPGPAGFAPGARVRLVGLHAQPEMNDKIGNLVEWFASEQRWKVHLDDGSKKMFNPANLEVLTGCASPLSPVSLQPGTRIRVGDLQVRTDLNGQMGTIVEYDEDEDRWKVRMDDGSGKMFRLANLTIV